MGVTGIGFFTVLSVYGALTNTSNGWTVVGSASFAVCLFYVAAYKAWRDLYDTYIAECARNLMPDINGELEIVGYGATLTGYDASGGGCDAVVVFGMMLCNHRPVNTTLQGIGFDGSLLKPPVVLQGARPDWFPAGTLLPHGIGVPVQALVFAGVTGMRQAPPNSSDALKVQVVDAFGNRHSVSIRPGQWVQVSTPTVPPDATVSVKIG